MLSVIVIAKNEEANLARCLQSVSFADEIIVLDSGSEDNTVSIAKTFTHHVYETDWMGYGVQKQRALAKAQGDWVLNLDADEWVDDTLKKEIIAAVQTDEADAYRIPIRMVFYDKLMRFSSSPERHVRLFKRLGAEYSQDLVHEKILLPSKARIGQLKASILHKCFQDLSHAIYKMNKYSSYSAEIRIASHKPQGFLKTLLSSSWMFFRCYFLQRGFLDGKAGFILATLHAQGSFYKGLKCHYRDANRTK